MVPAKAPKAKPVPKPPSREEKDEALHVIIGLIDQFCKEHLNEEYAVLCRKLAEKLARKRPSPLLTAVRMPGPAASCGPLAGSTSCTTRARRHTCVERHRPLSRNQPKQRGGEVGGNPQDAQDSPA